MIMWCVLKLQEPDSVHNIFCDCFIRVVYCSIRITIGVSQFFNKILQMTERNPALRLYSMMPDQTEIPNEIMLEAMPAQYRFSKGTETQAWSTWILEYLAALVAYMVAMSMKPMCFCKIWM